MYAVAHSHVKAHERMLKFMVHIDVVRYCIRLLGGKSIRAVHLRPWRSERNGRNIGGWRRPHLLRIHVLHRWQWYRPGVRELCCSDFISQHFADADECDAVSQHFAGTDNREAHSGMLVRSVGVHDQGVYDIAYRS